VLKFLERILKQDNLSRQPQKKSKKEWMPVRNKFNKISKYLKTRLKNFTKEISIGFSLGPVAITKKLGCSALIFLYMMTTLN